MEPKGFVTTVKGKPTALACTFHQSNIFAKHQLEFSIPGPCSDCDFTPSLWVLVLRLTLISHTASGIIPGVALYAPLQVEFCIWLLKVTYSDFWTLATQSSVVLGSVSAPVSSPRNLLASHLFLLILAVPVPGLVRNHLGHR